MASWPRRIYTLLQAVKLRLFPDPVVLFGRQRGTGKRKTVSFDARGLPQTRSLINKAEGGMPSKLIWKLVNSVEHWRYGRLEEVSLEYRHRITGRQRIVIRR